MQKVLFHSRIFPGTCLILILCIVFAASPSAHGTETSEGLKGRLIVGYQGWFGCPGDYAGNDQWQHWFTGNSADPDHLHFDLLPSLDRFRPEDLCNSPLRLKDGSTVRLFSSQNERIVATHFQWMAEHGIDGAAVQRFIEPLSVPSNKRRSDHLLMNAKAGAEAAGRVFFITYDVSGANPRTVMSDIRNDWQHLVNDIKITSSPSYLQDNGKPVLEIWGFGFHDRPGTPDQVSELIGDLKDGRRGLKAVTLLGGVPTGWRTLTGDSKKEPGWAKVYRSYDVISPWSVGRFGDDAGIENFIKEHVLPDMQETKRLGIGYMPVIFPGFSWYNLQRGRGAKKKPILNQIPRRCGDFLWHQVYSLLDAKVDMLYAAMFDEVDEGTALFPTETREDRLPKGARMVYLNRDGCSEPDDWYLQITGEASKFLHGHKVPQRQLNEAINISY